MSFDENGNLEPYEIIEISLERFERIFVNEFGYTQTRQKIFDNYLRYTETLQKLIKAPFYQWIDGSFATWKTNPNDIDLVSFVPFEQYEKNKPKLEILREWRFNKDFLIDGYILCDYPASHKEHFLFELDKKDWRYRFGTS